MRKHLSIIAVALLACACSKVPRGIIEPEDMAQLLADFHTGESVVELNRRDYASDSLKQAFKQSIYMRHGVTSEQVDSSFAWYGRNITYYMDVYDRTIEILEHRLIETGNRIAAEAALSVAGDSVDVWSGPRYVAITDRLPSKTMTFSFGRDENWERGDIYTWRAKFFNNMEGSRWSIVAEYADGTLEYITQPVAGDGWKEISLNSDSLLDATRFYGFLEGVNRGGTAMTIDSIEIVRKRVDRVRYHRRNAIRRFVKALPSVEIAADSIANGKD